MKEQTIKNRKYLWGMRIVVLVLILICFAWIMQLYSILNWEHAVKIGLQSGSFNGDLSDKLIAKKEWGEAMADLIWPLPLTIIALTGILRKTFYGFITAMMIFSICVYFPLFYVFQAGNSKLENVIPAVLLWGIPSVGGIAALWFCRRRFLRCNHV